MAAIMGNDDLLCHLYDAVMAPGGFQPFIEKLVEVFRLKSVTMVIRNGETAEVKNLWRTGISRESMEIYVLDYAREDMLAQHITISPIAHFYASNLDVPDSENFAKTRFYNEWVVPSGMAYSAGAIVLQEGPWLTQLFVQRAPFHTPFVREEMDQLNHLMPHLQRAIQMRQRFTELQFGQNFLAGGLDVLAMPTFLFDEYGRVVHYNRSATDFLSSRSNMWLDNGHLQTADSATTRKLAVEIGKALFTSRGGGSDLNSPVLLRRDGHLPLMLMVAPLQLPTAPTTQAAALLFAFDPEAAPSVTIDLVRRLFALSEAEAELSVALCCGKSMDDVAKARGTSLNTIKSQLKSTFLKTGTKRQSELVSLLLASPAYFLAQKQQAGNILV